MATGNDEETRRSGRLKMLLAVLAVLGVGACGVGVYLYVEARRNRPLEPITRDELLRLLSPDALAQLRPAERDEKLAEYGARIGMMDKAERDRMIADIETWKAFFSLSQEDRMTLMMGAMPNRLEQERARLDEFFKATPEVQEKMLDERIDRILWIRALGKGAQTLGIVPKPEEQKGNIRGYLSRKGRDGRKTLFRGMLSVSSSKDRAMMQEHRRRMYERGHERGIDFHQIERGE